MGGFQYLTALGGRTASGIRSQHHEIKYKKPTATDGNCGDGVSRMILCDSSERNLKLNGRRTMNGGSNPPVLNRFESPRGRSPCAMRISRRGAESLLPSSTATAWQRHVFLREFPKTFFWAAAGASSAATTGNSHRSRSAAPEGGGGG